MKIFINGSTKEFKGTKIAALKLVIYLNLDGKRFAIEKNGQIIPKSRLNAVYFNDGDKIEIIGAVGGG
jgi:sulfur carrier protein